MVIKLAGRVSSGKIPNVFLDNDIARMEFDIHDFEFLQQKPGDPTYTGTIKAHGHFWYLCIYPHGDVDVDDVSIGLVYTDENTNTNPVVAKGSIRTKTTNREIPKHEFSKEKNAYYCQSVAKRIIENDCDDTGTLTITVDLQVATEKRSVWYPQLTHSSDTNNDIGRQLYNRTEYSDITFMIGQSKEEFYGHKCILFVRSRDLCELVVNEEESSSSSNNNCIVVLADVDEKAFQVVFKFIYTGEVPKLNNDNDDDDNEELAKSILLVANRFGITELKLYMESILVEKFLVPSKAAGLLLFADSYTCPLLKEATMDTCITDPKIFMDRTNDGWKKVQESSKLLSELLVYTNNDRKRYSLVIDGESKNGDNTLVDDDVDDFDVTSLRERLQQVNLDVDGSREILVQRWKDHVRANDNKEVNED